MKNPVDAYREGFEKGRSDNLAGHVTEGVFGMLRDDPGGYYMAGYSDGAAGKAFKLPSVISASQKPAAGVSVSDAESAWFRLCDSSEFISPSIATEFWERLKAAKSSPAIYMVGLHPFYELSCPQCGEAGHFKGHFLGRVRHPRCSFSWIVKPPTYIGKQLAAVYHTGLKAGGSVKDQADRKGEKAGWLQAFLAFYLVAVFRLMAAIVLIPIQAAVSMTQPKPPVKAKANAASGN